MSRSKFISKLIISIIRYFFLIVKYILNFMFNILSTAIEGIINRLRFSITLKITLTYVLIFSMASLIMSVGIIESFNYYIKNNNQGNYIDILVALIMGFNILSILFIMIVGVRVNRKLLSPLVTMNKTVKEISINALDKRLDVRGTKDELKDLSKTFNDMLDRIQVSVELQRQFVSDASHELRTPISVIQGYANLLDRWGKNDPKVLEESIVSIKSEADSMKNLVEKLLFLARGDNNTQRIEKQKFMLNEVLDEVVKETRIIDTGHNLINNQNQEIFIYADRNLLKEAIRIFIDNSIKYTPRGGDIKLDSYLKGKKVIISIEDTGVGISKEDLPHIFNRFYRADKSRTKTSGGTGLGLAIAKWIIDHHDGKINVISELNKGTLIKIEIPIE